MKKSMRILKNLAKDFNLKFDPGKFDVAFLPKEDVIIYLYLAGCPDKKYSKYGQTQNKRMKNIERFFKSKEFSVLKRRYAGAIIEKKAVHGIKVRDIENHVIRRQCNKIISGLKSKEPHAALLPVIRNRRERKFLTDVVLFHEWVHALLLCNGINFQKRTESKWYLDEGLANYMMSFSETGKTEVKVKTKDFQMRRGLSIWNRLLKDKLTPKERHDTIADYLKIETKK